MEMYFRFPDGKIETFTVESVWTFRKMTRLIQERCGLDSEKIRFIFAGKVLNMKHAFSNESTIQRESTINVIF